MSHLFKGQAHVGILTGDAQACVEFYCKHLGFRPWYADKMGPMPLTFVENGGMVIEFIAAGNMSGAGAIDHISIEVLNIEEAVAALREGGVQIGEVQAHPDFFPGGMKNVFFTGPAGEKIELVEFVK